MMAGILASRLLGLVRNAVISHQLGQSYDADVYNGAFQIPDLLFYLIAGGALSSAFIPVFTELMTHERKEDAWRVFSTVFCVMFVVVGAFVVVGEIFAEPLVRLVNWGFTPAKVAQTVPLTRIVLPAQICFFMGGILMGAQYALGKFRYPALGPVIYNLGIIIGGLLLGRWLGMPGLCWGALAGAIVGNFGLQWWAARKVGMQFQIRFDARNPSVMKVWKLMLPVILGVALPQVSIWINRAFSTRLGDGPMSALTYANQLMQVPLGIFAQAMAVAIFPTLSAMAARRDYAALRATSSGGIRSLLFLTVPASALMIVLATPIVQLLLQHGKFHASDTPLTVAALTWYCAGIFAWSAQSILSRSFYALHDTKTPVVVGTLVTLVFIPMNVLFMTNLGWGIQGLALATTVAATLHMVAMIAVLSKRLNGFELGKLTVSIGKTMLASGVAAAACWAAKWAVAGAFPSAPIKIQAAVALIAGFGVGAVVYVVAARLLRAEELGQAIAMLRRRRAPVPET
jgi:putative peptidoglycan lipid II flippase